MPCIFQFPMKYHRLLGTLAVFPWPTFDSGLIFFLPLFSSKKLSRCISDNFNFNSWRPGNEGCTFLNNKGNTKNIFEEGIAVPSMTISPELSKVMSSGRRSISSKSLVATFLLFFGTRIISCFASEKKKTNN